MRGRSLAKANSLQPVMSGHLIPATLTPLHPESLYLQEMPIFSDCEVNLDALIHRMKCPCSGAGGLTLTPSSSDVAALLFFFQQSIPGSRLVHKPRQHHSCYLLSAF